jgi:hypothetical protein
MKRLVCISDLHCGHRVGLTPPYYQTAIPGKQYHRIQVELWDQYVKWAEELQPIDILLVNGDAIDGKGKRSGSSELITADRNQQCDMSEIAINQLEAKNIIMTYGTGYHTGNGEDYEYQLAKRLNADISSQQFFQVNNTTFDAKHKVGGSSIPHGRATPLAKERLWNYIWNEFSEQPKADVIIRSHVHYHTFTGEDHWLAMTTPALQGQGSKFGARICNGTVHFGLVWFDCHDDGSYEWSRAILHAESQKQPLKSF